MATSSKKSRQKQKDDALELALLLYDIFKEEQTNGNVSGDETKIPESDGK
jgi:hypothetical protein